MMTTTIAPTSQANLTRSLKTLGLSGMLDTLPARLDQAANGDLGFQEFLQTLLLDEINRRDSNAYTRRIKAAHFDQPGQTIETFQLDADPNLPAPRIRDLAALDWWRNHRHLIIYGPVGCGKTHLATALGIQIIRAGGTARFITCSSLFDDLAGGHADNTWTKRLRAYTRPDLLILDDFAIRALTGPQADDLYEIITARAHDSIIATTNRRPEDWYPLFPNPVVAESLMDRLVNNAHQLGLDTPSYRARQRPTE